MYMWCVHAHVHACVHVRCVFVYVCVVYAKGQPLVLILRYVHCPLRFLKTESFTGTWNLLVRVAGQPVSPRDLSVPTSPGQG